MNISTPRGRLTLRPEADDNADVPFLFALFSSTRADELALMPLDDNGRAFLLQMQFRSMNATYRAQHPHARFEIIELDDVPIGRLVTDVQPDCVYYVDIALLPERRRGGIATALMTAALEEPRRLGVPGRVRVMMNNPASLRLCERLGMMLRASTPPMVELEWRPAQWTAAAPAP